MPGSQASQLYNDYLPPRGHWKNDVRAEQLDARVGRGSQLLVSFVQTFGCVKLSAKRYRDAELNAQIFAS